MSVLAVLDLSDKSWSFDVDPESPSPDVQIGFTYARGPVEKFDNLSFGFDLSVEGEVVLARSYPEGDAVYQATDQTYLSTDRAFLSVEDEVVFSVWAVNDGISVAGELVFTVPVPPEPEDEPEDDL